MWHLLGEHNATGYESQWINQLVVTKKKYGSFITYINKHHNGPLARYVKLRVAHAPVMPGTFSPPPLFSKPDMHHGTCVTHVPWCMPGSLTNGFLWNRWREKRSRHPWRIRNPRFCVSSKRPIQRKKHKEAPKVSLGGCENCAESMRWWITLPWWKRTNFPMLICYMITSILRQHHYCTCLTIPVMRYHKLTARSTLFWAQLRLKNHRGKNEFIVIKIPC